MSFLEQRFLRQFREDGDAYVIIRRGREVRFSPTEVAVIAPLWIAWNGHNAGALIFAFIAALFMVVVLTPVWQKPGEVAESRLPFEPDAERAREPVPPSWWQLGLAGVVFLMYSFDLVRSGGDPSKFNFFALWTGLFTLNLWQMLRYKQGKWNVGQRDPVQLLILAVTAIAVATATALNPNRDGFDVAIAGLFGAMLAAIVGSAIWKQFRPSPHAA